MCHVDAEEKKNRLTHFSLAYLPRCLENDDDEMENTRPDTNESCRPTGRLVNHHPGRAGREKKRRNESSRQTNMRNQLFVLLFSSFYTLHFLSIPSTSRPTVTRWEGGGGTDDQVKVNRRSRNTYKCEEWADTGKVSPSLRVNVLRVSSTILANRQKWSH